MVTWLHRDRVTQSACSHLPSPLWPRAPSLGAQGPLAVRSNVSFRFLRGPEGAGLRYAPISSWFRSWPSAYRSQQPGARAFSLASLAIRGHCEWHLPPSVPSGLNPATTAQRPGLEEETLRRGGFPRSGILPPLCSEGAEKCTLSPGLLSSLHQAPRAAGGPDAHSLAITGTRDPLGSVRPQLPSQGDPATWPHLFPSGIPTPAPLPGPLSVTTVRPPASVYPELTKENRSLQTASLTESSAWRYSGSEPSQRPPV